MNEMILIEKIRTLFENWWKFEIDLDWFPDETFGIRPIHDKNLTSKYHHGSTMMIEVVIT